MVRKTETWALITTMLISCFYPALFNRSFLNGFSQAGRMQVWKLPAVTDSIVTLQLLPEAVKQLAHQSPDACSQADVHNSKAQ